MSGAGNRLLRLDGCDSTLLLGSHAGRQFSLLYWGDRLPDDACAEQVMMTLERQVPHGVLDQQEPLVLLPETGLGFVGTPGIELHFDGADCVTAFRLVEVSAGPSAARLGYRDALLPIFLEVEIAIDPASDVVSVHSRLRNDGDREVTLQWLAAASFPIPGGCDELLAFEGRWCREFNEARLRLGSGAWSSESRAGRDSHHSFPGVIVGRPGFDADGGEVYGLHLGWSGNHRVLVERLRDGRLQAQLGELPLPGEFRLGSGECYESPVAYAVRSAQGLDGMARRLHEFVRERILPSNVRRRPRPVTFSTWESLYFDHDQPSLEQLVDTVAGLGVERFVLDDGWFRGRVNDRAGLGDWEPCPLRYPQGLQPIARRVRAYGMQFGLWIEPEMVNEDSDLYRAHPEWVMGVPGLEQPLGRQQYVLDLGRAEVQEHLFGVIDGIVESLQLDFLKWDMNRDMTHAVGAGGRAVAGRHVRALYALLDRLRARHPALEIESCASGGARADYAILERAERIWTSDSNDPLERQRIQRGFALFFPPEIMGCHVGPAESHTTGRHASMTMRAGTALAGHFGIELDPRSLDDGQRAELAQWVEVYKRERDWLHRARLHRLEHADPTIIATITVARDGREARVAVAKLDTSAHAVPGPLRLAGLAAGATYRVQRQDSWRSRAAQSKISTGFLDGAPVEVPGVALMSAGIALPLMPPGSLCRFAVELVPGSRQ